MVYTQEFLRRVKVDKITNEQQMIDLHNYCYIKLLEKSSKIVGEILTERAKKVTIQFKQGSYKNLSPGYDGNHNLNLYMKEGVSVLRRWKEVNTALEYLNSRNKEEEAAFINVYGERNSGKSSFLEEVGKILVERQFFNYGVYMIPGLVVQ